MLTFTVGSGPALEVAEFADFTTGCALYRVDRVGTFTLDWDSGHHNDPEDPDAVELLRVTYGAGTDFRWHPPMPDAPVLFGITLAGQEPFTRGALGRNPMNLRPHRMISTAPAYAPVGVRRRTNAIVHTLVDHWLDQPWTPDLRRAHAHHHAPHTLATYSTRLANTEQRFQDLEREQAFCRDVIDRASTILKNGPVPAPDNAPPSPDTTAATTSTATNGR
ncbi:hypothetical protein RCO28_36050 [Streptomyces sp. LHD-70]|uniref:hypothetical protein n=1 Tax=Streptomyces sp. LHD-70 TaxID=3072140 RepID=UPI00280E04DE|nr:hypothetical protein [Streptomyces sp. LHD-70]MDQ8707843.1 hypothetical protein [Streptomyces sp. LHD-70]